MAVKNLKLSVQQVSDALGVCPTAASRKIAAAEKFLQMVVLADPGKLATSRRPDRVRVAVVQKIRTIAALQDEFPESVEQWLDVLIAEGFLPTVPKVPDQGERM